MQLDTDEGEAFVPPAGVVASPNAGQATSSHDPTASTDMERSEVSNEDVLEAQG